MTYSYPLQIHFKFFALAPRVTVIDAQGQSLLYVEQKLMALKESVRVFANEQRSHELFHIQADRILDFNAEYTITDAATQQKLGSMQREGMASILKASYMVKDPSGDVQYTIKEKNPWVKVFDTVAEMIPFVSFFTGYFFHPEYGVFSSDGQEVFTMHKKASFTESSYDITAQPSTISAEYEQLVVLALMMMVQLERSRG